MEIGISDTRNIIGYLTDLKDFDFSSHSVILIKHRIESFMTIYSYQSVSHLLETMTDNDLFLEVFVQYLLCGSTEMFRDPSFWLYMKESILPQLFATNSTPHFWIPACVSGDELYSLCYILKPYNNQYTYRISAGCFTQLAINQIKKGLIVATKLEVSAENAKQVLNSELCFTRSLNEEVYRDSSLVEQVNLTITRLSGFDKPADNVDFLLCRNRLLNYNLNVQQRIVQVFHESLSVNGFFAVGIKEHAEAGSSNKLFKAVSELECVFQKNNGCIKQ